MAALIGIRHRAPALRRGLMAALGDRGFDSLDLTAHADAEFDPTTLSAELVPFDGAWPLATHDGSHAGVLRIAIITDDDPRTYRQAYLAGAAGVVSEKDDVDAICDAVAATLAGRPPVPKAVLDFLIQSHPSDEERVELSPSETAALILLASGATVPTIASEIGYSERETFRILHHLYRRMGVKNRAEAIVLATRWGVIEATT